MGLQRFWQDDVDPTKRMDVLSDSLPTNTTSVLDLGNQSAVLLPQGLFMAPIRGTSFPTTAERVGQLYYHDTYGLCKATDTAGSWTQVDHTQSYISTAGEASSMTQANLPLKATYGDLAVRAIIDGPTGKYLWSKYSAGTISTPVDPNEVKTTRYRKTGAMVNNATTVKANTSLTIGEFEFYIYWSGSQYSPTVRSTTGSAIACIMSGYEIDGLNTVQELVSPPTSIPGDALGTSYGETQFTGGKSVRVKIYTASFLYEIMVLHDGGNNKMILFVDRTPLT